MQMTISISFTILSVCCMCLLGVMLYQQFTRKAENLTVENSRQLLNQTTINLEDYLRNMRRISDAMYYTVIKNTDIGSESLEDSMNLLYEANKDKLVSVACYTNDGKLTEASPIATEKPGVDVKSQKWFQDAAGELENFHFSTPHVQNLFDDPSYRYYWVVSLSRTVELTRNGNSMLGVLLVDMNYSSIEQLLEKANTDTSGEYVYLMAPDGEIIYHPKQNLIHMGLYEENNTEAAGYEDTTVKENFHGEKRLVTVKTISYTGWKLISVVPMKSFSMGMTGMRNLVVLLVALTVLAVVILNQMVSARISKPLRRLNDSVKEWEAGNMNPDIYIGGSMEVEHLGKTLRSTVAQIRQLMDDIVVEQEEKRKSELDALQSQINPHFLYNTLDSIVWMITGERYDDAVFMITQLASLFRISLSKGKTVIKIEDEVKHARNYMNIQKIRYKNSFEVDFQIEEDILDGCIVKLVLQPLLENAIYYGMEFMDGEGEIHVRGYRKDKDVYLEVEDNGLGMPEEEAAELLNGKERPHKHGSGVGLVNVHSRLKLRFGEAYGLVIHSCPDEGMMVQIHIPYIPYTVETQKFLESGKDYSSVSASGKEGSE
ncbi:sensor histidine kinase [Blautia wexlerae]|uniref:sensor histidine kinase n=1 Tax=Blautia wexlerae TaxID=418240 RepID=UPI000E4B1FEB|nr:histidine kinase [Blautia wexlerae]MBL6460884.1 histidine kinase [Blautia sp.]MDU3304732.1 histidine kinase [Lachnospiraceae bacterium]RHO16992.1 HAMP domain-containing protein [Ruminococcus sp. AM18-44]RHO24917.1 HAMP domain-containing protein [Ruminococcus sp. AM18-15]RHQ37604.1 HAMP domain-containing protein [Ruminococcus sp. AF25-28AC]RHS02658.1 HAMP domain-containing protein [Ruminococcus sp. AF14-5]RHS61943.1 HAMP domain-containing protein [Ruminococcus sp. AM45-9BH]RHS73263.1 HAMP